MAQEREDTYQTGINRFGPEQHTQVFREKAWLVVVSRMGGNLHNEQRHTAYIPQLADTCCTQSSTDRQLLYTATNWQTPAVHSHQLTDTCCTQIPIPPYTPAQLHTHVCPLHTPARPTTHLYRWGLERLCEFLPLFTVLFNYLHNSQQTRSTWCRQTWVLSPKFSVSVIIQFQWRKRVNTA